MVNQGDFPSEWSCESENKRVVVEVRVPETLDPRYEFKDQESDFTGRYSWVEIPTTSVEQWIEKGDAAEIQRTAKVRFPTEWGENTSGVLHNSPRKLIQNFDPTGSQPFMMARIWWQENGGEWILQHFGWIGGVGPSGTPGISKLWIYDLAELLGGVPIGETFSNPSIKQATEIIARLTNENTPIPLSNVIIVPPKSDEEFEILAEQYDPQKVSARGYGDDKYTANTVETEGEEDEQSTLQGPAEGNIGGSYYSLSDNEFISLAEAEAADPETIVDLPNDPEENFESLTIDTGSLGIGNLDAKSFVANHDSLLDIYRWFEEKTSAKLHFEPMQNSVALVADIVPERRTFAHDAVIDKKREDGEEYSFHAPVSVIQNDALYEMKPKNTLHLRGSTPSGWFDETADFIHDLASELPFAGDPPAEKYPVVKVQVPELVEAADGVELSGPVVESDATQLDNAIREAEKKLTQELEETTEGEIILNGTPRIMPFDAIEAFEECYDFVEYEQEPVKYEVESVKHEKESTDIYKTRLKVSVWANEDDMVVIRDHMAEAK